MVHSVMCTLYIAWYFTESSFLSKEDVTEVVVPAFEGEMGILKDHISIISFLKPGIISIQTKSGLEKYYVEDGIIEFKNNNLSILTSSIFDLKNTDKSRLPISTSSSNSLDTDAGVLGECKPRKFFENFLSQFR